MAKKIDILHSVIEPTASGKRANQPSQFDLTLEKKDDSKITESNMAFVEIPLSLIVARSINQYSQRRIESLARSIVNTGNRLIHPIVVAELEQLPDDGEIKKGFIEKNIDLSGKKYVIVAGERRYRAFLDLKERFKKEHEGSKKQETNPFETITANVLKRTELKNEHAFYEDSNIQTRQLTPTEAILHVRTAFEEVQTPEQKYDAMKRIYKDNTASERYPKNKADAEEKFRMDEYVRYYLAEELGIEGWSASTIRTHLSIVRNCDEAVVNAIIEGKIAPGAVRKYPSLSKDVQKDLLGLLLSNDESYKVKLNKAIRDAADAKLPDEDEGKRKRIIKKYYNTDVRKEIDVVCDKLLSENKKFELMISSLDEEEKKALSHIVRDLENTVALLREKKGFFIPK